jgi:riboflavin biosynthesis pyrimidine reductase
MRRPRISCNLAISADGKISNRKRRPSDWTSAADKERLVRLRHGADALLVGRGTLDADRMTLTVAGQSRQPLRCIVSRQGHLDPAHPLFHRDGGAIHLLATDVDHASAPSGVVVHTGALETFLHTMAESHGVAKMHCEGGGELVRALAQLDAIDELHLTLAGHVIFGGHDSPTLTGMPGDFLPMSRRFRLTKFASDPGGECYLTWLREDG